MKHEINRLELVWPGKYDSEGNLSLEKPVSLPFQIVERVKETRATREARENRVATLFDVWDQETEMLEGEIDFKNKLIWGDNKLVIESLLDNFAGKVKLIYIDPPFAVGSDFNLEVEIGGEDVTKQATIIEEVAYRDTWGRGNTGFIDMLYKRLRLMRDLLAEDGAIYVHIDYRTSSMVKTILDEIFGVENFRGWLVWLIGTGAKGRQNWSNQHNDILCYSKGEKFTFNHDDPDLREPFAELSSQMHFNKTDQEGRKYRERIVNGKSYIYYADDGKLVGSVWTDISSMAANSPILNESVGYPTQKPEKLLNRIIKASSNPGDLIADFFAGSGTTLAVAEKLGRNWIGADLGRFSIHTCRKRLLEIENCRPFEILNLGNYERQYWSNISFGEDFDGDGRVNLFEYIAFILKLYGATALSGGTHLHGKYKSAFVHVGSVSSPVTIQEIEDCIEESVALEGKELHILGWEWEMGLIDTLTDFAKKKGIRLVALQIPREVMEAEAARKGQVKFFELSYLEVEIQTSQTINGYICELIDFVIPNPELVPAEVRNRITAWSDFVDYWAIDWDFRNDTFIPKWMDYRTKSNRDLNLISSENVYPAKGEYKVMVKVVDIFGNDTTKIIVLKVK
jgi:adenine-specific DNA-methyltransferase